MLRGCHAIEKTPLPPIPVPTNPPSLPPLFFGHKRNRTEQNRIRIRREKKKGGGGGNVPVESEDFAEDQDQDHADEDPRLLHVGAHALVTDDADAVAGGEAGQADREAAAEVHEAAMRMCVSKKHVAFLAFSFLCHPIPAVLSRGDIYVCVCLSACVCVCTYLNRL